MTKKSKPSTQPESKKYTVLVAVDFSPSSAIALKTAKRIMGRRPDRIIALHVVDHDFVERCIVSQLGRESEIKKKLFLEAKAKLREFLLSEGDTSDAIEEVVCEGVPFLEINKKAIEKNADIIVMGTHGTSGDMQRIFFGSTTERVLRFIKRPVLCVPISEDRKEDYASV